MADEERQFLVNDRSGSHGRGRFNNGNSRSKSRRSGRYRARGGRKSGNTYDRGNSETRNGSGSRHNRNDRGNSETRNGTENRHNRNDRSNSETRDGSGNRHDTYDREYSETRNGSGNRHNRHYHGNSKTRNGSGNRHDTYDSEYSETCDGSGNRLSRYDRGNSESGYGSIIGLGSFDRSVHTGAYDDRRTDRRYSKSRDGSLDDRDYFYVGGDNDKSRTDRGKFQIFNHYSDGAVPGRNPLSDSIDPSGRQETGTNGSNDDLKRREQGPDTEDIGRPTNTTTGIETEKQNSLRWYHVVILVLTFILLGIGIAFGVFLASGKETDYCEPWTNWTSCSVTCGVGEKMRTRRCHGNSSHPWTMNFTDSAYCSEPICTADCDNWSPWTECSKTCGQGSQTRTRDCHGNSSTPWNITFQGSQVCSVGVCPAYCEEWSSWSGCSATCGPGVQTRSQDCYGNSSEPWNTTFTDSIDCSETVCPAYCEEWSSWSKCSSTCGPGVQLRTQTCHGNSSEPWITTLTDSINCTDSICPGYCTAWTEWSDCSVSCGVGSQRRIGDCYGNSLEPWHTSITDSRTCTQPGCYGQWQPWGDWTGCDNPCGCGITSRYRECSTDNCGTDNDQHSKCDTSNACINRGSSLRIPCLTYLTVAVLQTLSSKYLFIW